MAICSGGNTKSTCPVAIADIGIQLNIAVFSSWANVNPPTALIAVKPKVPSLLDPDRTTAIARLPQSAAREVRKASRGQMSIHTETYVKAENVTG